MDTPKYSQPPLDPAVPALQAQAQQRAVAAMGQDVNEQSRSLTAKYGALTSGDRAWLLSRYGTQLALAGAGGRSLATNFLATGVAG